MKLKKLLATFLLIFIFLGYGSQASAICEGPLVPCGRDLNGNNVLDEFERCTLCHIFELLNNILEFFLTCLVPITAVLMLVIGGVLFMLSRLEIVPMDIFSQAKGTVTAVVIGLLLIFVAWAFLNTFLSIIGISEWTGLQNWWEIRCGEFGFHDPCQPCQDYDQDGNCIVSPNTDWGDNLYDCRGANSRCVSGACQTGQCLTGSECLAGQYCRESDHRCITLSICTDRYNAEFGYFNQALGQDVWNHCGTMGCEVGDCDGNGSCRYYTDGLQHNCGNCFTCNSSGQCSAQTTDWGDNLYGCIGTNNRCDRDICLLSGECCISGECSQCSDCASGEYCQLDHTCADLPFCAECNAGFDYNPQENNEDLWNECGTLDCSADFCNGSYGCLKYTDDQQHGCDECHACDSSGSCAAKNTDWEDNLYGCVGVSKRCVNGACMEGCDQCSDCLSGQYCDATSHFCTALPVCTQCNSGFGYFNKTNYEESPGCTSTCTGCFSGSCMNVPDGQKDTYESHTCSYSHQVCNGSGSCYMPLGSPVCIANWYWFTGRTCSEECILQGYDFCYTGCGAFCISCNTLGCYHNNIACQCRNYLYD